MPDVPLTNAAGWLLVGTLLVAALDRVLAAHPPDVAREALPAALLAWTWLGSTLANLAFFDRPWVALYGGDRSRAARGPVPAIAGPVGEARPSRLRPRCAAGDRMRGRS